MVTGMISRRRFVQGACLTVVAHAQSAAAAGETLAAAFTRIEAESGGRLGIALLDTQTSARSGHRADESFPLCSTFKLLAAAAILARVDAGRERLDRRVRFEPRDVLTYSPATKERAGGEGMTLDELCAAAMTLSDNTAANLLLSAIDGPAGMTTYARTLGDMVTRLDRTEPDLNEAQPGDPRDTTSPAAMVSDLNALLFGNALTAASKERLVDWLLANRTGDARLRAGLPSGWRVGDKTGSGEHGTANDVGILWPPRRAPILIAVYLTDSPKAAEDQNAVHAAVARAIGATL
jgi:beta-lactamase class A